ncbi:hypothetical protein CH63R_11603 [Colletotrichum higginsianum IMI 349063]|uniref:Uncharacterized protein n=1 Tax=Colletotrichum higginsianum (strain IMI 349063) TaxID=759273 RepID=A0A1B7XYS8_COLHI|nr:hypothetical protein CH63R_11603 [Colletotrichum higginsianum IMI 349063]OBR04900.1 hypothetical protein CH63R_11603 [Colletotrichum higginsianum IMI 349063]
MGLFGKSSAPTEGAEEQPKKSLYQRYQDKKTGRDTVISDEDLVKYTGKRRDEINDWAKDRPGVAGNRAAGTLAAGSASGFGGMATADGYGGWGMGAGSDPKHPPQPSRKGDADAELSK